MLLDQGGNKTQRQKCLWLSTPSLGGAGERTPGMLGAGQGRRLAPVPSAVNSEEFESSACTRVFGSVVGDFLNIIPGAVRAVSRPEAAPLPGGSSLTCLLVEPSRTICKFLF